MTTDSFFPEYILPTYQPPAAPDPDAGEWLWPGWLKRGELTLLVSTFGGFKTYLALDLARRIMDGLPFPDGCPAAGPAGNVVYVDADMNFNVVAHRFRSWGVAGKRFYPVLCERGRWMDLRRGEERERLTEMVVCLRPELVIVDSLDSVYVNGEGGLEALEDLFAFLGRLAQIFETAVLLTHSIFGAWRSQPLAASLEIDNLPGSGGVLAEACNVMAIDFGVPQTSRQPKHWLEMLKVNV